MKLCTAVSVEVDEKQEMSVIDGGVAVGTLLGCDEPSTKGRQRKNKKCVEAPKDLKKRRRDAKFCEGLARHRVGGSDGKMLLTSETSPKGGKEEGKTPIREGKICRGGTPHETGPCETGRRGAR